MPTWFADIDRGNALCQDLVIAWQTLGLTARNVAGSAGHATWVTNSAETGSPVKMSVSSIGHVVESTHDYALPPGDDFNPVADSDNLTVAGWTRPTVSGTRRILRRGKDGFGSGWSVSLGSTSLFLPHFQVVLTSGGASAVTADGTTDLSVRGGWIAGRLVQGAGVSVWCDGRLEASTASTKTSLRSSTIGFALSGRIGGSENTLNEHSFGMVGPVFAWKRALADGELREFLRAPYQVFRPLKRRIYVAGSGGQAAALEGNAQAQATATGALTTQIPLAGAAVVVATMNGALTTAIPLEGAAASVSVMNGALTTEIRLTAAALAVATMGGELTTQIALSGAALAQVTMSGELAGNQLQGAAQAQATAAGALTTQIPLVGAATAQAGMAGGLTTAIPLLGAAASVTTGEGVLLTEIRLSAAAVAQAIAAGGLTTQIPLQAAALVIAAASGTLTGSVERVIDPRFAVAANERNFRVAAAGRSFGVAA